MSSGIARALKGKQLKSGVKFETAADVAQRFNVFRTQAEGPAEGGKSHFMLKAFEHIVEYQGVPLDETMFCLIDSDKEGVSPLLLSGVIPVKYQEQMRYAKCENIWQVYEAFEEFDGQLKDYHQETGRYGCMAHENMGKLWYFAQRDYVEAAFHIPYVEHLMKRQEEATARDKKTLPALDQMLDYRNINPLHNELAEKMAMKNYNLIWTALPKERKFQEGNEEVKRVVGEGQKGNDARVDFIIRLYETNGMHFADSRKLRGTSNNFIRLKVEENSFTTVMLKWHELFKRRCKKNKTPVPEIAFMKKDDAVKRKDEVPEEELEEEDDEEEIELED